MYNRSRHQNIYLSSRMRCFLILLLSYVIISKSYYFNNRLFKRKIFQVSSKTQDNDYNFRFGVIADIQYADADDAMNFQGTKMRRYRNSLEIYKHAVHDWNQQSINSTIACAVVLGDLFDGKTAIMKNQEECYQKFSSITNSSHINTFYCFGNHCHYSFSRQDLYSKFLVPTTTIRSQHALGGLTSPEKLYYDYSPYPGWRFIFLDSYDISLIGASNEENREISKQLLHIHNPNDLTQSGSWFNNLPYHKRRWVPYNGGISQQQLSWLDNVLSQSVQRNERVMIFAHQPVYAPNKPQSLIWNSEEILSICYKYNNVRLWMAGHDHEGQYGIDPHGIHHLVPPAPIEAAEGDETYGYIDVYENKLVFHWKGHKPKNTILPFPTEMKYI